jgi:hypothetical protein
MIGGMSRALALVRAGPPAACATSDSLTMRDSFALPVPITTTDDAGGACAERNGEVGAES